MSVPVDAAEIMARCERLAEVSSTRYGIRRVYLTPEHATVNALAAEWMREAGMSTWQDAAGNQWGRYEAADPGAPALVLGSHLDTVTNAGRYDGILGVLLAIAVVSRLHAAGERLPLAVEVVAFGDEEGTRFGTALLGSRAVAGTCDEHWWSHLDADGVRLDDAFRAFGLEPSRIRGAARTPAEVVGYLEAHIEQGPVLLESDRALAVVSAICGARRFGITVTGTAGHAGTPFGRRQDALVAASEMIVAIERIARAATADTAGRTPATSDTVATVGRIAAYPGGVNVIAGQADFSLDLRAADDASRDRVWGEILAAFSEIAGRRDVEFRVDETHSARAAHPDAALRSAIEAGIAATGDPAPLALVSRAGHDAMAIAELAPFAMLFVRCGNGGISHHPDELVA